MRLVYVMNYAEETGYLVRVPVFMARPLCRWLIRREHNGHRCWDYAAAKEGI